jgi:isopentenyl-diphosphate Delta-isomerase
MTEATRPVAAESGSSSELVVLVDEAGQAIGTAPKEGLHGARTPLHLAFSCHVFNPDGMVLMTRRALTKAAFPGVWTNAFCGHPSPGEDLAEAVHRRAMAELGIQLRDVRLALPHFRYQAVDSSGIMENEICPVFVAVAETNLLRPSPAEVEDHAWSSRESVSDVAESSPWLLSPWCVEQVRQLRHGI